MQDLDGGPGVKVGLAEEIMVLQHHLNVLCLELRGHVKLQVFFREFLLPLVQGQDPDGLSDLQQQWH